MVLSPILIINILTIFLLLLFSLLLFHVGRHTKSNRYLGFYFISQILVLSVLIPKEPPILLKCFLLSVQYAWGSLFYLFICSLIESNFQFRLKNLWLFVPTFITLFFLIFSLDPKLSNQMSVRFPLIYQYRVPALIAFFNILIIGFNVAAILRYAKYRTNAKINMQLANSIPALWLNISLWGFVISCVLVQVGNQLDKTIPVDGFSWKVIGNIAFLIYFCILFYVAIVSRSLTDKFQLHEKYKKSSLIKSEALLMISQLDHLMMTRKPYVNTSLKLKDLSEMLKISERNLSQLINEHKQQNFSDYVNTYRVKYAMKLLTEPSLKEKTILWVLFEAGFNSKSSFNTIFKKVTGCTPAEYRKNN
jgi:AraC-like DNA-binding protein